MKRRQKSRTDFYHIIVKGINNELIFNQSREKVYFKSIILKHLSKYPVEIYSYCIMSNHAHFIIRAELKDLSVFMAAILAEYASYYNNKHDRNGHVFQNRFKSFCIEDENYFWSCLRYIHLNPYKGKITNSVENYEYSSMKEYVWGKPEILAANAFEFVGRKFEGVSGLLKFHQKKAEQIFDDILPEVKQQQEELSYQIAEMLQEKYQLKKLCQVLEEKMVREELQEKLSKDLKISKRRTNELCLYIKNRLKSMNN